MKKLTYIILTIALVLALITPAMAEDTNWLLIAEQCAISGDIEGGEYAIAQRDAKIDALGLDYEKVTFAEVLAAYTAPQEPPTDWMALMIEAAVTGDIDRGNECERMRNDKIAALGLEYRMIAFEDLYLLGKIMTLEAGNCAHDVCPLGVGEVVLNRVASPEWDMPDTIAGVLTMPYQYYYPHMAWRFESANPDERCVRLALRLLEGERHLIPSVIFHDNWAGHGGGVHVSYKHEGHGTLYFMYSGNAWMYE